MRHRAALLGLSLACGCATTGEPSPPASAPSDAALVCDGAYLDEALALIDGATAQLSVAQYELFGGAATGRLVDAIEAAVDRGVSVRLLFDDTIDETVEAVQALVDRGMDARVDGLAATSMHAKLLVADGARALVGSTNWSTSSIERNHECNLRLDGGPPPAYVAAWFDLLWADPGSRAAPSVDQSGARNVRALTDGELLPALVSRIERAGRRIDFTLYATYLQPTNLDAPAMQLFGALAAAAERGVPVRAVVEWSDWQMDNNERNGEAASWLEARGVQIRFERPDVITHAKTFLIDDVLQVQSANVSTSGFERNHEVAAFTDLAGPVGDFEEWFDALWLEAGP